MNQSKRYGGSIGSWLEWSMGIPFGAVLRLLIHILTLIKKKKV